jgi:hypothetical protein
MMQETEAVANREVNGSATAGAIGSPMKGHAERGRRYRARKKAGKMVVTVEIDEPILAMLAAGTQVGVEILRKDRGERCKAVRRALRHMTKRFRETGKIPS